MMRAQSSTVRASGPTVSMEKESGIAPWRDTRLQVGLIPDRPQKVAGDRINPPVSDPSAAKDARAAPAAPEPEDEPPVMHSVFQGLRQCPKCALCPVGP